MRQKSSAGLDQERLISAKRRSPKAVLKLPAALAAVVVLLISVLFAPAAVSAVEGIGLAVAPLFPPMVAVGDAAVPAQLSAGTVQGN